MRNFLLQLRARKIWWVAGVYIAASWLLMQVVGFVEEPLRLPDWADTLAIVLLGIGFPIALILAWAQETQATKPEFSEADEGPDAAAGIKETFRSNAIFPERSIAVLPYDDFTDDRAFLHLADGISEDIITHLSFDPSVQVQARNSSFQFKGTSLDVKDIAARLNVNFILEGSVRKIGDTLRITSQLIDATDGTHIWADRSDQPVSDIARTQDDATLEISGRVTSALFQRLRKIMDSLPEEELPAFGLGLRAYFMQVRDGESRDKRRALLHRSIDLADPEDEHYPRSALITMLAQDVSLGFSTDRESDIAEIGRQGEILLAQSGNDPIILANVAGAYTNIGRFQEAYQLGRQAYAIAPQHRRTKQNLAFVGMRAGHADESIALIDELRQSSVNSESLLLGELVRAWICKGDFEKALEFSNLRTLHQGNAFLTWLDHANILATLGQFDEADVALGRVRQMVPRFTLEAGIAGQRRNYEPEEYQQNCAHGLELMKEREAANG